MIPLMLNAVQLVGSKSRKYYQAQQAAIGTLNGFIEETVTGQKVVKVFCHEEIAEEEMSFPLGRGRRMYLKRLDLEKNTNNLQDIPQNQYTKWFDYDKIIGCLTLRNRREGDYLTMRSKEALQHKKVKDYMITEKIPKERRKEIPLLAEGEHVLWLVGYRISEYYKVDENTKRILQVRFTQSNRIAER